MIHLIPFYFPLCTKFFPLNPKVDEDKEREREKSNKRMKEGRKKRGMRGRKELEK